MDTFEEKIINDIKNSVLKQVSKCEFVKFEYGEKRSLPSGFLDKAWQSVDWGEVLETIRPELQRRICNAIVGNMESEIKTDVKSLLSVDGVRQKLRMEVYPVLMKTLDDA